MLTNLKALLSGLRPTGHSQPYLKLPLCGPLSFQAWQYNPRAAEEQGETMQEDKKDYLTGGVKSGVGPGLLSEEAGCPYHCSRLSRPLAGPEIPGLLWPLLD